MNKIQRFTLVEIMIVVAIIGILAAIAVPGLRRAREHSQRNSCIANLKQIQAAKQIALAHDEKQAILSMKALVKAEFLRSPVSCPVNGAAYVLGDKDTPPTCPNSNNTFHKVNGQF